MLNPSSQETAIFAGGCFWCEQELFQQIPGVISVKSGYTGGTTADPTYEEVCSGRTGHVEAVQIVYDPDHVTYDSLLRLFWRNIDPFDPNGQFCDRGPSYKAAIFYSSAEQKQIAEQQKAELALYFSKHPNTDFHRPITTLILPATQFYDAEGYHQDYSVKNPFRYSLYRQACGREERLNEVWNDFI